MAHALGVAVLDALHQLAEVEAGCGLVEAPVRDDLVKQLAARDELEHDEDLRGGAGGWGGEGDGLMGAGTCTRRSGQKLKPFRARTSAQRTHLRPACQHLVQLDDVIVLDHLHDGDLRREGEGVPCSVRRGPAGALQPNKRTSFLIWLPMFCCWIFSLSRILMATCGRALA